MDHEMKVGDIVRHFKREYVKGDSPEYLYEILAFAHHSETNETLVVYRALYYPYKVCARPYDMFMSEVDHEKYPDITQKYRFEVVCPAKEKEAWREEKDQLLKAYHIQNRMVTGAQAVFAGSSLMEMFPIARWTEGMEDIPTCYNRGVGGYTTADLLKVLNETIFELDPSIIYLNIGTNDLSDATITMDEMIGNYQMILNKIKVRLPETRVVLMAYYPVNPLAATEDMQECLKIRTNEKIARANQAVAELAARNGMHFLDVNAALKDENGNLKAEYTTEGLHINEEGYKAVFPLVLESLRAETQD